MMIMPYYYYYYEYYYYYSSSSSSASSSSSSSKVVLAVFNIRLFGNTLPYYYSCPLNSCFFKAAVLHSQSEPKVAISVYQRICKMIFLFESKSP